MTNCPTCGQPVLLNNAIEIRGTVSTSLRAFVQSSESVELKPGEARILKCLLAGPVEMFALIERQDAETVEKDLIENPKQSMRVQVHRLRKKLEPLGWTIEDAGRKGSYKGLFVMRKLEE